MPRRSPFPMRRNSTSARRNARHHFAHALIESLEHRVFLSANVLSYRNGASGDGLNTAETVLTPANVGSLAQVASTAVDGQIYTQPLVVQGVNITTGSHKGAHDVVYVATENDSVYAIDTQTGIVLWQTNFLSSGVTTIPPGDVKAAADPAMIGITSTPVIDTATNAIYVVAETKQTISGNTHYVMKLHALNLGNGTELTGAPVTIADTICNNPTADNPTFTFVSGPSVNGTGVGGNGSTITYNALIANQRESLALVNGVIYIANSSHADQGPYHGWVLGYNEADLSLKAVFNDTPNGSEAGIWSAGGTITSDSAGNLYVVTGNGTFDTTFTAGFPAQGDYGESVLKLAVDPTTNAGHQNINGWGLKVADYFTPHDVSTLNTNDYDLSSEALLLPPAAGSMAQKNLLLVGDKRGELYLLDTTNLGKFNATTDQVVQENIISPGFWSTPAFYNGNLYVTAFNSPGETLPMSNASYSTTATTTSAHTFAYPGATPTISSNGASDGVVWQIDHSSNTLYAYSAAGYNTLLFTAPLGATTTFTPVTVANGLVFASAGTAIDIFGLPPVLKTAVSRKVGGAGTFDIPLNLTGTPSVEDRTNGPTQLVLTFASNIAAGASFSVSLANFGGGSDGSVSNSAISGSTLTLNLTGISDGKTLVVMVTNLSDVATSVTRNFTLDVGVLLGDVLQLGAVNALDFSALVGNFGQPTTAGNFMFDLDSSGAINAIDFGLMAQNFGKALQSGPAPAAAAVTPVPTISASPANDASTTTATAILSDDSQTQNSTVTGIISGATHKFSIRHAIAKKR